MFKKILLFFFVLAFLSLFFLGVLFLRSNKSTNEYLSDPPFDPGKNNFLLESEWIHKEILNRPYGIAIDTSGFIYTGTEDRKIVRIRTNEKVETFAILKGRPLGMVFDPYGNLLVCVEEVGIVEIRKDGSQKILISKLPDGSPLRFPHGIDVTKNGKIYFTVSSRSHSFQESFLEELSSKSDGMILTADKNSGSLVILNENLFYPTGIAVSSNEQFLLVSEPFRHRISSVPLSGQKKGMEKFFLTNIPGLPALITGNSGSFWIGIPYFRNQVLDRIQEYPEIKNLLTGLPNFLFARNTPRGLVFELNDFGDITANYQDISDSSVTGITSVLKHAGNIYLVSLTAGKIAKMKPIVEEIRFF
ncbi:SMP-30/gluconolactonase/LRE family protein [Leptospira santarosai]|uniref:SMP-30/gluconolactonase/LRE family protein n=1 Tax=Leptospira santarosai TaxID=28183 RepID=UPI0024AEFDC9|nr:SMP-30/gluconolactonase/LRE family protein [Leptospira santarosai]MDI7185241.1 SMP-30/gluconolactonase/LRE family protein [Leptospira santarosai]MDI7199282.1 SMP-30/gluconolactonase/LRE family protein [Leptospira santarosai]